MASGYDKFLAETSGMGPVPGARGGAGGTPRQRRAQRQRGLRAGRTSPNNAASRSGSVAQSNPGPQQGTGGGGGGR